MKINEKEISYQIQNSYSTLNEFSTKTKNTWFVFHGLGFLSRYFIEYFNELDPDENYIIAPQAQNKHYLKNKYKHVGATWLTKEKTQHEFINVTSYLDKVYENEMTNFSKNKLFLGFSLGVSIVTRWIAKKSIACDVLILYAGKIPREFQHKRICRTP